MHACNIYASRLIHKCAHAKTHTHTHTHTHRQHVCDECNSGHQGQCGYAVHCEQIGEPELLEEVKTGVKMGHKNEAQAQKCGGRCCKCLK